MSEAEYQYQLALCEEVMPDEIREDIAIVSAEACDPYMIASPSLRIRIQRIIAAVPALLDAAAERDQLRARVGELEAALRDAREWLLHPSDVYPQQVERLLQIGVAIDAALTPPASAEPDDQQEVRHAEANRRLRQESWAQPGGPLGVEPTEHEEE
jgi:hypothetical protein